MRPPKLSQLFRVFLIFGLVCLSQLQTANARHHHSGLSNKHGHKHSAKVATSHTHVVHQYLGSKHKIVIISSRHKRHRLAHHGRHHRHIARVPRVRYAYPLNFFLLSPPEYDNTPLSTELTNQIHEAFDNGLADKYPTRALTRAQIITYAPLHGGIFFRREPIKYIIMHSTETGVPQDARRVIASWGSAGRRHAGAQYVVDRDGKIYQAVDPDLATVHVNIFKTLPGINNDNAIGIEMVHAGSQTYTRDQLSSVIRLVAYLQGRYQIANANIITHRYAQQGDHTDPVNFDWDNFIEQKNQFESKALKKTLDGIAITAQHWPVETSNISTSPQIKESSSKTYHKVVSSPKNEESADGPPKTLLRGPIELDPSTASLLNKPVTQQPFSQIHSNTQDKPSPSSK